MDMRAQFYVLAAVVVLTSIYLTARYLNEGIVLQPSVPSDELSFVQDISSAFQELSTEPQRNLYNNFQALDKYINERSLGSFGVSLNCSGQCPSELIQVRTQGHTGKLNFQFNITEYAPERIWWDDNVTDTNTYDYRLKLIISDNNGIPRTNWPFVLNGAELNVSGVDITSIDIDSIRLVDPSASPDEANETGGNDLALQIDHKDGTGDFVLSANDILDPDDEIVFVADLSIHEVKDLYFYYSTSGSWTLKNYTTDLLNGTDWVNNSLYQANYTPDWSEIDGVIVDFDGDGYEDEEYLINDLSPDTAGSITIYPSSGPIISGPVRIIIDSAVYNVTSSSFNGNISRRIIHWAYLPRFEIIHSVDNSNNYESNRLSLERLKFRTSDWYRCFYPDETYGPLGSFGSTTVEEQLSPGYMYAVSYSGGAGGLIFTDSPANYDATTVIQWALENDNLVSRKLWLRDGYSEYTYSEAWVYVSNDNSTNEPVNNWYGLLDPAFSWTGFKENR